MAQSRITGRRRRNGKEYPDTEIGIFNVSSRPAMCSVNGNVENRRAVFLDRDGVINRKLDNDYVKKWDEFEFLPRAKEAIKTLTDAGWEIIVISNQAGIGKGIMSAQTVEEINARMVERIEECGGKVKAVYYCPHRTDDGCECRKPKPGMLLRAAREFGIELLDSYLIGDNIADIQAGAQVGCITILVKTGRGRENLRPP